MKKLKMKRKTKQTLKTVACVALGLGAVVAGAKVVSNLNSDEDTKNLYLTYSIGGLDESGKYIEDDGTLYTKTAFECKGLSIDIDFDATVSYEVFFYDESGDFVESSGLLTSDCEWGIDEMDPTVTHARIEITPNWEMLEIDDEDEQVIKFYETYKYSKQLKVSVDSEQSTEDKE